FSIATPAETQFEIARFILEHKKPVLVEKPLALTSRDARTLKKMADEAGVPLMVGHVLLFHPAIRRIKTFIREGKIGKLQYLYSNRLNLGAVRKEENILWSFAPHDISIFQYIIEALSKEVISRGGAFLQPHIHDSSMTILTYPNNIIGHIFVSWLHPFKEQRRVVIGSKGMLSFEDSSNDRNIYFYEKGIDWIQGEPVIRGMDRLRLSPMNAPCRSRRSCNISSAALMAVVWRLPTGRTPSRCWKSSKRRLRVSLEVGRSR
ncbi:MAG: Gfo/Idh/MocA family oxidoreductase, partial [Candidatus Sumerlaeota bacterium]|nr:Gfo/Idh/MocA family oxidoreductase [Candidatus Sumerlaeota bacterium]